MGFGRPLHLLYRCYENKQQVERLYKKHLRECTDSDSGYKSLSEGGNLKDCCFLFKTRKTLQSWLRCCMTNEQHRLYLRATYNIDFINWVLYDG